MSTVAVIGATGTAGRPLSVALGAAGHEVRQVSRRSAEHPADLDTGEGLAAALSGCEIVFDVANAPPRQGERLLPARSRRLDGAATDAGVGHLICLSIVGIDYVPIGYYGGKLLQERVVAGGTTPWTLVRCTQFHELLGGAFMAAGRLRLSPRAKIPLQPIAAREAGSFLADLAGQPPARATLVFSGPGPQTLSRLASTWAARQPHRLLPVPLPLPPKLGRALRAGALVGPPPHQRGKISFEQWVDLSCRTPAPPPASGNLTST